MKLYGHPFSSYTQKALIAFYENDVAFEYRVIGPDDPAPGQELAALWPLAKFPVLVDGDADGAGGQHHHRAPGSEPSRAVAADPGDAGRGADGRGCWTGCSTTM